jgi:hypothetical protein
MKEELLHIIRHTHDGRVIERMPEAVGKAFNEALVAFKPEPACIRVPTFAFYVFQDGSHYLADYMIAVQKVRVIDFIKKIRPPTQGEKYIAWPGHEEKASDRSPEYPSTDRFARLSNIPFGYI